jgi:hypothetical protein
MFEPGLTNRFVTPPGNDRYLRIPAITAPSSDNKIHYRDSF